MSGRELDPDGTDSYHPQHPWEGVGHPLYLPPRERTSLNWPPEPAYPAGAHEAKQWDRLPVRVQPEPSWRRPYGYAHPGPTPQPTPHLLTCPNCPATLAGQPGERIEHVNDEAHVHHTKPHTPIWARWLKRQSR